MESKRNDTSIYKTEIDSNIENKLMVIEGKEWWGEWGLTHAIIYKIDNFFIGTYSIGPTVYHRELYSTSFNNLNGKESEKEYTYICK